MNAVARHAAAVQARLGTMRPVFLIAAAVTLLLMAGAPAAGQGRGPEVAAGTTAVLRGLDKVSGETTDMTLETGAEIRFARLDITLVACRYPVDAPESDAFAFLEIRHYRTGARLFRGWMIASSPALNALDDARFDVWVLSCR